MALHHIDIESALRRLADRKIEEAMEQGKFDNLPGKGKPLNLDPLPPTESGRLRWWSLRILKQGNFTPDEVTWRKEIDQLKEQLDQVLELPQLIVLVNQINRRVHQLNTLGTNAIELSVSPLDLGTEVTRFHKRQPPPEREPVAEENNG